MSLLQAPPELADGGYWYVVPVVPDPELGGQTPGDIPGQGWCAWYSSGFVAVRCPAPVDGVVTADSATVKSVLDGAGYAGKPFGRVGGS